MRGRTIAGPAAAWLLAAAGCVPLPIAHTAQTTPRVAGVLQLADGTPAAGVPVAVTHVENDPACTRAGVRARTDGEGRFSLPAARERRRVYWLSMMENFGLTHYWLCAGPPAAVADAEAEAGAEGLPPARGYVAGFRDGDRIACLLWRWRDRPRVTCNDRQVERIVTGGRWNNGRVAGHYRLLLPEEGARGYAHRAVIQWIVEEAPGGPVRVHAEAELPTEHAVHARGARLSPLDTGWTVTVRSLRGTRWGNERWLTYALGGPGEVEEVTSVR